MDFFGGCKINILFDPANLYKIWTLPAPALHIKLQGFRPGIDSRVIQVGKQQRLYQGWELLPGFAGLYEAKFRPARPILAAQAGVAVDPVGLFICIQVLHFYVQVGNFD